MENSVAVGHVPDHLVPMSPSYQQEQKKRSNIDYENFVPSQFDEQITMLLDEFVRPAVEQDGGAIDFKAFHEGKVYVQLRGACSGCPSSMMTLKGGIENLLKANIQEVEEVVAEEV